MTFKVIQGHWKWHESIRPQILGPIVYTQRSVVNNCGKCFPTVDWNCAGAPALDNRMKNRKIFCNSGPFIGAYPCCCCCCCWHILWNPSPAHSMLRVWALYRVAVTVAQNRPSCTFSTHHIFGTVEMYNFLGHPVYSSRMRWCVGVVV